VYFRGTFRTPFTFGAMLSHSYKEYDNNEGGSMFLDGYPDDETAAEQQAYEMVEAAFGGDVADKFAPCSKPEDKQLADDTQRPCLYMIDEESDWYIKRKPFDVDTLVQYREPASHQVNDLVGVLPHVTDTHLQGHFSGGGVDRGKDVS